MADHAAAEPAAARRAVCELAETARLPLPYDQQHKINFSIVSAEADDVAKVT